MSPPLWEALARRSAASALGRGFQTVTSRTWLDARVRRHTFLPHIAGGLVLLASAILALAVRRREDAETRAIIGAKTRAIAGVVEDHLAARDKELTRLAAMWQTGDPRSKVWEREALHVMQTGEFRSIAWIDAAGHVVSSVPAESAAPNATDPNWVAAREDVSRVARTTGQLTTSRPFVAAGVPVSISAVAVERRGAAITGESALPAVLKRALESPEAAGYSVVLLAGQQVLFARTRGSRKFESTWEQVTDVGDAGSDWRLRAWPTPEELARRESQLPEGVLVMGMLLAITVAGMMHMYQTAERRAHALSRANRLLEAEIRERERAQDALERSEQQLRQSQKMEAVGRLAGGIAHDFNNLLTAISGYSDFLMTDIDRTDPRREDVREIKKAATRAAALTAQLLAFSRRQIRQPRPLDLNAVLTGLDRMLRRVIGEDVRIDWQPSDSLGSVLADPSEIEQVLVNLIVNASDAMPSGGTITVRTSRASIHGNAHAQLVAGSYVCLTVSDTGSGMDANTRSQIFEPFFTTKEPGKGTGLGLSTVYAIVQHLHGAIEVETRLEQGTTFTIHLPLHDEPAEVVNTGSIPAVAAPRGVETVLLVEDEDGVRALGSRILERHGYTVIEARNGREALTVAAMHQGHIDLLLTDVVMPEMGGKQLANTLLEAERGLRVLFMSGYTDGDISRRGELDKDTAFLQKPFSARALLNRVRAVLDEDAIAA